MNKIDIKMLVAIEQLIENPESVFQVVEQFGKAVILRNNMPSYELVKFKDSDGIENGQQRISPNYKLHEAMQIVLSEHPEKKMHAKDLADAVYSRGLYLKKDGTKAMANQIRARCERYSDLFIALENNVIKLKAEVE